jgi:hypothetical protein
MSIIADPTEARRAHRLARADAELAGYFTSNVGLKVGGFTAACAKFNVDNAHEAMLRSMKWLSSVRSPNAWYDAVTATLRQLDAKLRARLVLVYAPHSWPTWLADALSPAWGGGSFVALAATLPRAAKAAEGRTSGQSVLGWFDARGRDQRNDALWRHLKDDCLTLRLEALEAYEPLRVARSKAEAELDRETKRAKSEKSMQKLTEVLGIARAKRAARFERKIKRAA